MITRLPLVFLISSCAASLVAWSDTATQSSNESTPTIFLEKGEWPGNRGGKNPQLPMLGELVRQALIVSAELDLGWRVLDETFNESPTDSAMATALELEFSMPDIQAFEFTVSGPAIGEAITHTIPGTKTDPKIYKAVLEHVSREFDGEGILKASSPHLPQSALPHSKSASETRVTPLPTINPVSGWLHLRALDKKLVQEGITPSILSQLSAAYAVYGTSNYYLNSPIGAACHAKALIYAQRLVKLYPNSSDAYYARAFAWAVAGFHVFAEEDLNHAESMDGAAPEWLPLIRAFIEYDYVTLREWMQEDSPWTELAGMLSMYACRPVGDSSLFFDFADPAIERNPKNLQLFHLATEMGGVSKLHWLTSQWPEMLKQILFEDLSSIKLVGPITKNTVVRTEPAPSRPKSLGELLLRAVLDIPEPTYHMPAQEFVDYPKLYDGLVALQAEGIDTGSPSTAMLAEIIREHRFNQVMTRLHFLEAQWGVSVDSEIGSMLTDIKGHPYEVLAQAYRSDADIKSLFAAVEFPGPEFFIDRYMGRGPIRDAQPDFKDLSRKQAYKEVNHTYEMTPLLLDLYLHSNFVIKVLRQTSPHHPGVIIQDIAHGKKDIKELEAQYGSHPDGSGLIANALGWRYLESGDAARAKTYLKKAVEQRPSINSLRNLARAHRDLGEFDAWLETEEKILELPDTGLDHAITLERIAWEVGREKGWEEAIPYAESAAESYKSSSLRTAAWVHGLAGNFETGLDYVNADAERYTNVLPLIMYISRFNINPTEHARQLVAQAKEHEIQSQSYANAGFIHYYEGSYQRAAELFEEGYHQSNDFWYGIISALFYEAAQDRNGRDRILKSSQQVYNNQFEQMTSKWGPEAKASYAGIGELINSYSAIAQTGKIDHAMRDQLLAISDNAVGWLKADIKAIAGEMLRLYGHEAAAKQCFEPLLPLSPDRNLQLVAMMGLNKIKEAAPSETSPEE